MALSLRRSRAQAFDLPSIGIIGTGKRVGKTAVASHAARLYGRDRSVLVVAMGRGGPAEPVVAEAGTSLDQLLELAGEGHHAASDYLEDAALAGVDTIGCRRAGGGLAGAVATSNVAAGPARRRAWSRPRHLRGQRRRHAADCHRPPRSRRRRGHRLELLTGYLNAYRILVSDLVVLTNAEDGSPTAVRDAITAVKDVPVVATVCVRARRRPRPARALPCSRRPRAPPTAGSPTTCAASTTSMSSTSRETSPTATLFATSSRESDAEVYLIEIKAAAIDVVATTAAERGVECVFVDNQVLPLAGEPDLDAELQALAEAVAGQPVAG